MKRIVLFGLSMLLVLGTGCPYLEAEKRAQRKAMQAAKAQAKAEIAAQIAANERLLKDQAEADAIAKAEAKPRAERIVYEYQNQIWSMAPDGSGAKGITQVKGGEAEKPALSRDGRQLVYVERTWPKSSLVVIAPDGSNRRVLLSVEKAIISRPAFDWAGKTIYYAWNPHDTNKPGEADDWSIYSIPVEGGKPTRVIAGDDPAPTAGGKLVYVQSLDRNWFGLSLYDPKTQTSKRLTKGKHPRDSLPNVAADGTIVYESGFGLWVTHTEGRVAVEIKNSVVSRGHQASLSPDGKRFVVYVPGESHGPKDKRKQIWIADLNGKNAKRIGSGEDPYWGVVPE